MQYTINTKFPENNSVSIAPAKPEAAAPPPTPVQPQIYGDMPEEPTQNLGDGILFDFNCGCRMKFPDNGKEYRLVLKDADSELVVFAADVTPGAFIVSVKKFFVRFRIEIYPKGSNELLYSHEYDAAGKTVVVQLPPGTLGDSIAWFSYVERFQQMTGCKLVCAMSRKIADIFEKQYPGIKFVTTDEVKNYRPYACYLLGLFFRGNVDNQPLDFRYIGLHRTAGRILGVPDASDLPPRVDLSAPRRIAEKYVCIATQASSQCKYWNNPWGWDKVIEYLKKLGFRVLCIDRDRVCGSGLVWNHIPQGAEDFTGDLPLQERIDLIKDAAAFIGLSSGLSWLAWCCRVPVVMISGFTEAENEFYTPYRVINYHACHGCWNDMRENFDHFDYLWCPRHKGTDRHFECTRLITPEQVIRILNRIPTLNHKGDSR